MRLITLFTIQATNMNWFRLSLFAFGLVFAALPCCRIPNMDNDCVQLQNVYTCTYVDAFWRTHTSAATHSRGTGTHNSGRYVYATLLMDILLPETFIQWLRADVSKSRSHLCQCCLIVNYSLSPISLQQSERCNRFSAFSRLNIPLALNRSLTIQII